uniref:Clusterin n=1 Tax=Apteryx owenii TaxID=8824 RepID=A0A8B9PGU5_APTOW
SPSVCPSVRPSVQAASSPPGHMSPLRREPACPKRAALGGGLQPAAPSPAPQVKRRASARPGRCGRKLSAAGSKYIDAEVENAIDGVKHMKTLMDRSSKEHRAALHALEETKRRKDAVRLARAREQRLAERQEACNDTVLALWEECKPCLKRTCMRFYSRVCHSGSGLVGRQLEELLNRSSPFSVWVDGERVAALLERERRQERRLEDLEERFGLLEDGVDDLFQDSARVYGRPQPFFGAPGARPRGRRDLHPFFPQPHLGFHHLFQPFLELTQRMAEEMRRAAEQEAWQPSDDRMVCREIRRNSAGCLKMRDECEKCREILSVDCSQTDPEQSLLREQLEDALRLAERFSRRYDDLLRDFQADMLNTTGLLEQLNRQFGWVSRLANLTQHDDGFLQVTTVGAPAGGGVPVKTHPGTSPRPARDVGEGRWAWWKPLPQP